MEPEKPIYRRLRVFAFDPGTTAKMDTATINEVILKIPWEDLQPGPVGEYVAVVDQVTAIGAYLGDHLGDSIGHACRVTCT